MNKTFALHEKENLKKPIRGSPELFSYFAIVVVVEVERPWNFSSISKTSLDRQMGAAPGTKSWAKCHQSARQMWFAEEEKAHTVLAGDFTMHRHHIP